MSVKTKKINKSVSGLLRTSDNLKSFVGDKFSADKLAFENSQCCGIGRKTLYFAKAGGTPTLLKYPIVFNGQKVKNNTEFSEALTTHFGVGYIAYVISTGNAVVLGSPYKKNAKGQLDIPDYILI